MAGRVVHFEIQSADPEGAILFYEKLFGWKFEQWGDQPYWLITTGPSSEPGINGGLLPRRGGAPETGQAVNCYVCTVDVASVDASLEAAQSLGGKLAVPRMAIPKVGWLAYAIDPDGNIFGMMQSDPDAK